MFRSIAAAVMGMMIVSSASLIQAQTIYAPVQYQYGQGEHRYYYGGSDPAVIDLAERQRRVDELSDHRYTSERYNDAYLHHRLIGQLDRVYSDAVPYLNARVFGYLPVDAANDANANVPLYFRKADLLAAAVAQPDGTRVVPAHARPVVTVDRSETAAKPTAVRPRAIIIIPRSKPQTSDKLLKTAMR
jgi:hypothetical protein